MKNRLLAIILAAGLFCLSGCGAVLLLGAGATAGVLGYKYYDGNLEVNYKASFDKTMDAVSSTFSKQNIRTTFNNREISKGKVTGEKPNKETVTVTVQYVTSEETKVSIRIGHLGDKKEAEAFEQYLRKELFN